MNYAVFTFSGEGLSCAERLQREGNTVIVGQIRDEKDILLETEKEKYKGEDPKKRERRLSLYKGILKRYSASELVKYFKNLSKEKRKDWFLFFDFNQCFKFAEQLKDEGYYGNFPTAIDRKFEVDRNFAKEFVKQHYPDVKVAEEHEFDSAKDAIKFLEDSESIWVLKGKDDNAETIVPDKDDPEEAKKQIINTLTKDGSKYEKDGFILELKIPNVIEITPEIQFYDGEPLFATVDLENKQIGAGNESFMTGCAQDLVFELDLKSKLAEMSFPPVVYGLAQMRKGWFVWDLSILFDPKTNIAYMGEFCPNRPGYNAILTELATLDTVTEFFEAIVQKKNPFEKKVGKFGASVRMFDFDKDPKTLMSKVGDKIGFTEETYNDLWLFDVKKEGKEYVTAGYNANPVYLDVAVITGYGATIEEAVKKAYMYVAGFNFIGIYNRPEFDYLSKEYPSSIPNRYQYLVDKKLL